MICSNVSTSQIASVCAQVAPVFTQLKEEEAKVVLQSAPWRDLSKLSERPINEPTLHDFHILRTMLFLPGVAFAALPVESLYKPRQMPDGTCVSHGMYGGPSARHIEYLCQELGFDIPREFSATPDHMAILLELVSVFAQASNEKMLTCFIEDHFDWLETYQETLKSRIAQAHESSVFDNRDGFRSFQSALLFLFQTLGALMVLLGCKEVEAGI